MNDIESIAFQKASKKVKRVFNQDSYSKFMYVYHEEKRKLENTFLLADNVRSFMKDV